MYGDAGHMAAIDRFVDKKYNKNKREQGKKTDVFLEKRKSKDGYCLPQADGNAKSLDTGTEKR